MLNAILNHQAQSSSFYHEEWCGLVWQLDSSDSISMMTWVTIRNILIDLYDILNDIY
jgi:hypothetical protein